MVAVGGNLRAQRRPASAPETQLMAYFASVVQFSPSGLAAPAAALEIGGSLGFIPSLDDEDRAAGFGGTKYENTNLCPVFPRLTASGGSGALAVEAAWTPPVEVCGAKANLAALALSYRWEISPGWSWMIRGSALAGSIEAPITCGEEQVADPANQTCFEGTVSRDRMKPLTFSFEAGVTRRLRRIEPYLLLGASVHRMHFDVNYDRLSANPLPTYPNLSDHNQFGATLARVHLAAGAALDVAGPLRLGAEIFASPRSLITVRGRASIALRGSRAR